MLALSASVADTYDDLGPVLELGYPSCVQAAEYHMLKEASAAPPEEAPAVQASYAKRLSACDQTRAVQVQVVRAAETVTAFAAALAALAGDETISRLPDVSASAAVAEGALAEGASAQDLGAATNDAVVTITAWLTAGYRKKQLEKAVAESAGPIARVLGALETVVREVYVETHLEQERTNLVELFDYYDLDGPRDPVQSGLRQLERKRRSYELDLRLAQAKRFLARLDHLSTAHEKLVQAKGALGQEDLLDEVRIALADTFAAEPLPLDPAPVSVPRAAPESAAGDSAASSTAFATPGTQP